MAHEEMEIRFLGDLQRLSLKTDDTLVVMTKQPVSHETAERLVISIRSALREPERKVIVVDSDIKLGVLGAD